MKTFNSKNGPMEVSKHNISYMIETLFYEISKELERQLKNRPANERFHLLNNILFSDCSQDMYIVGLMLHMSTDDAEPTVPVKFRTYVFSANAPTASELIADLDKLFQVDNLDVFRKYASISDGTKVDYAEMSDSYKINALATRLRNLNAKYRDGLDIYQITSLLDIIWFCNCSRTIDTLYFQIIELLNEE